MYPRQEKIKRTLKPAIDLISLDLKKTMLLMEMSLFFFILPLIMFVFRKWLAFKIIPLGLLVAGLCYISLKKDKDFNRRVLTETRGISITLRQILLIFIPLSLLLTLLTYLNFNQYFMIFPRTKTMVWLMYIPLYPLLVAYPQELIFKPFFINRYGSLFSNRLSLIIVNGISFGLFHIFYNNWIAPAITGIGGMLFAYRYLKTGSLIAVSIEHALWGFFLITTGLGWFFHSGCI